MIIQSTPRVFKIIQYNLHSLSIIYLHVSMNTVNVVFPIHKPHVPFRNRKKPLLCNKWS